MTKEEAIEALKEHKRQIDKEYINTRNSKKQKGFNIKIEW